MQRISVMASRGPLGNHASERDLSDSGVVLLQLWPSFAFFAGERIHASAELVKIYWWTGLLLFQLRDRRWLRMDRLVV
jgi:hypothetical protein